MLQMNQVTKDFLIKSLPRDAKKEEASTSSNSLPRGSIYLELERMLVDMSRDPKLYERDFMLDFQSGESIKFSDLIPMARRLKQLV